MPGILGATGEPRAGPLIRFANPCGHHRLWERAGGLALSASKVSAVAKAATFAHSWDRIGEARSGNPRQDVRGWHRAELPPACLPDGFALTGVVAREFPLPSRAGKRSPKREQHDPVHDLRAESAAR